MTRFFKVSGGGNDFLALIEPEADLSPESIRALCTRGLSVGADGVFSIAREGDAVRMRYANADGRPADLCLNGARCAAQLAFHLGWAEDRLRLETGAGPIEASRHGESATRLSFAHTSGPPKELSLEAGGRAVSGHHVTVGVPHLVTEHTGPIGDAPVAVLGPILRAHAALAPAGANVNFVVFRDRRSFQIRTFERGVEAETLACGTGVLAATAAGLALDRIDLPVRAETLGGFAFEVDFRDEPGSDMGADRAAGTWVLTGDARLVASGSLEPGALELPEPSGWLAGTG